MPYDVAPDRLEVPLLPLKNVVVFPRTIVNLNIGHVRSLNAANLALAGDHYMVVTAVKSGESEDPSPADLYTTGTLVEVRAVRPQSENTSQVEVEALRRVVIQLIKGDDACMMAEVEDLPEKQAGGREITSLMSHLAELFTKYSGLNNKLPAEAQEHIRSARLPGYMADLLAAHLVSDVAERQRILEMVDQADRLEYVGGVLAGAIDVLETDQRVRDKVRASIDKNQREFYLREQLKAIHDELSSDSGNEMAELRERLDKKGMSEDILARMLKEVGKLERMPSMSPETTVLRNYLDWALSLPWSERTEDRIDLPLAEQILEEDHYGLGVVKERILDFLAVRQLTHRKRPALSEVSTGSKKQKANAPQPKARSQRAEQSQILCFVGPPGVGKTSLGQSIARAMNRKFVRLSLGGVHDEAEIRGHRRTYVGAMPGRIIQAMKGVETVNPVVLLDEVDKMTSDSRGDPAAALLEVLDPAQNHTFTDHYLDVPYDLSDVFFICTANNLYSIPRALRDRMEVVEISGYTEEEKVQIARRHLLHKQVEAHGLELGFLELPDRMLRTIIRTYTREAGVRDMDRKLATICRKAARRVVQGRITRVRLTTHNLEEFLGTARYRVEDEVRHDQIGVACGMAWTEHGGELLPVEVVVMPGRGSLTITGRLGDVMQESARAALSFARSRAKELNIDLESLEKADLHIHLPEGAIPKDGPSAGITMATALISAITRRPVRSDVCMTGEITLTGRVLAIGGLKEKVLAAHRAGITKIIAPLANKPDWAELPPAARRHLHFTWVDTMDGVVQAVLLPPEMEQAVPVHVEADEGAKSETPEPVDEDTLSDPPSHDADAESPSLQTADSVQPASDEPDGVQPKRPGTARGKRGTKEPSVEHLRVADADAQFDSANS
ncbi:MAG: endopeptidase La [Chloroflexota bacterium]